MANNDELIERARLYVAEPGTWTLMGGDTHRLVNDMRNALRAADRRIAELERLARMVVDGQLRETEADRAVYRRGFRALLEEKR